MLPVFEILLWEQDGLVFLAFAKILYIVRSASQVERQRATCIVLSFRYIYVAVCESNFPRGKSVEEIACRPFVTRDFLLLFPRAQQPLKV